MTNTENLHVKTISREELYAQVWQTPMSRLAATYGVSGNGLKKICVRHDIPVPPRGYWAKKAAGQRVAQYRLQAASGSSHALIEIRPTPVVKPKPDTAVVPLMTVAVPQQLRRPHRLVADWIAEDKERRRKGWRYDIAANARYHPDPVSETGKRRYRVLDTLFKALEKQRLSIQLGDRQSILVVDGSERIEVAIREKKKRAKRPMTAAEMRWHSPGEKDWRQEMVGTGMLVFEIKSRMPKSLKHMWTETAEQTLGDHLSEILGTLDAAMPLLRAQRQNEAEVRRLREIEEAKAREVQQKQRRDDNRWRRFVELAHGWEDVRQARRLFDHLASAAEAEPVDTRIAEGLAWIGDRLSRSEARLRDADTIISDLEEISEWTYRN